MGTTLLDGTRLAVRKAWSRSRLRELVVATKSAGVDWWLLRHLTRPLAMSVVTKIHVVEAASKHLHAVTSIESSWGSVGVHGRRSSSASGSRNLLRGRRNRRSERRGTSMQTRTLSEVTARQVFHVVGRSGLFDLTVARSTKVLQDGSLRFG